jgi:hypothetical protein
MAVTYEPLATLTLGSAASTITFSSISAGYTDLVLILNGGSASPEDIALQFNGDTTGTYSYGAAHGNGSSVAAGRENSTASLAVTSGAYQTNEFNHNNIIFINGYSDTNFFKTVYSRGNNTTTSSEMICGMWRSTSAINSIRIFGRNSGHNFLVGSTFNLYGILAA